MFKQIKVITYLNHTTIKDYTPENLKELTTNGHSKIYDPDNLETLEMVHHTKLKEYYFFDEIKKLYYNKTDNLIGITQEPPVPINPDNKYIVKWYSDSTKLPKDAVKYNGRWFENSRTIELIFDVLFCNEKHPGDYFRPRDNDDGICEKCRDIEANDNKIYQYHEVPRFLNRRPTAAHELLFGCEIEKEDATISFDKTELLDNGYIVERDGSLEDDGFEIVSKTLTLNTKIPTNKQPDITAYFNNDLIRPLISANTSGRCGGHIHISSIKHKPAELLFKIRNYLPLFNALYTRRADANYCRLNNINLMLNKEGNNGNGRAAFHYNNTTLEIRIFPAVANANNLIWRIELIRLLYITPCGSVKTLIQMLLNDKHPLTKHLLTNYTGPQLANKRAIIQQAAALANVTDPEIVNRFKHMLTIGQYKTYIKKFNAIKIKEEQNRLIHIREKIRYEKSNLRFYTKELQTNKITLTNDLKEAQDILIQKRNYLKQFNN